MNNSNFLKVEPVIDGSRSTIKGGKRESSQPTRVLVFDLFETATPMQSRENLLHNPSTSIPAAKLCVSVCATISSIRFIAETRSLYDHDPWFSIFEETFGVNSPAGHDLETAHSIAQADVDIYEKMLKSICWQSVGADGSVFVSRDFSRSKSRMCLTQGFFW